jgi:hypothetical protein
VRSGHETCWARVQMEGTDWDTPNFYVLQKSSGEIPQPGTADHLTQRVMEGTQWTSFGRNKISLRKSSLATQWHMWFWLSSDFLDQMSALFYLSPTHRCTWLLHVVLLISRIFCTCFGWKRMLPKIKLSSFGEIICIHKDAKYLLGAFILRDPYRGRGGTWAKFLFPLHPSTVTQAYSSD